MDAKLGSIAIVDDDESIGHAMERLLTAGGWRIEIFPSAEDLLQSPFYRLMHLLVLDIQLPGMSGLELHKHMKVGGMITPVIYVTGYDHPHLRNQALAAGAADFFTKPFNGHLLIEAVTKHLTAP